MRRNNYVYPNIDEDEDDIEDRLSDLEDIVNKIAEKLGVERKSYYNWLMNGKIPATVLVSLAKMFGCSIDYLLGIDKERAS